ncbi:MAG: hypothetical protein CL840_09835 [Crocinitomicaceae bacterium]|nr:hypothetical protein [Crocinitomicaceae bacterium]|tara:strand:+ start:2993 stop:3358 length:366 start_codon:yes stop_codon:yes gene_type:complete
MPKELPDINNYKTRIDVIEEVARQIEKDLGIEFPLKLSGNPDLAYTELFEQTLPVLKETINDPLFSFKHLLYKIDINETKLSQAFRTEVDANEFEIYTRLIIERELQKVATRRFFKSSLNK